MSKETASAVLGRVMAVKRAQDASDTLTVGDRLSGILSRGRDQLDPILSRAGDAARYAALPAIGAGGLVGINALLRRIAEMKTGRPSDPEKEKSDRWTYGALGAGAGLGAAAYPWLRSKFPRIQQVAMKGKTAAVVDNLSPFAQGFHERCLACGANPDSIVVIAKQASEFSDSVKVELEPLVKAAGPEALVTGPAKAFRFAKKVGPWARKAWPHVKTYGGKAKDLAGRGLNWADDLVGFTPEVKGVVKGVRSGGKGVPGATQATKTVVQKGTPVTQATKKVVPPVKPSPGVRPAPKPSAPTPKPTSKAAPPYPPVKPPASPSTVSPAAMPAPKMLGPGTRSVMNRAGVGAGTGTALDVYNYGQTGEYNPRWAATLGLAGVGSTLFGRQHGLLSKVPKSIWNPLAKGVSHGLVRPAVGAAQGGFLGGVAGTPIDYASQKLLGIDPHSRYWLAGLGAGAGGSTSVAKSLAHVAPWLAKSKMLRNADRLFDPTNLGRVLPEWTGRAKKWLGPSGNFLGAGAKTVGKGLPGKLRGASGAAEGAAWGAIPVYAAGQEEAVKKVFASLAPAVEELADRVGMPPEDLIIDTPEGPRFDVERIEKAGEQSIMADLNEAAGTEFKSKDEAIAYFKQFDSLVADGNPAAAVKAQETLAKVKHNLVKAGIVDEEGNADIEQGSAMLEKYLASKKDTGGTFGFLSDIWHNAGRFGQLAILAGIGLLLAGLFTGNMGMAGAGGLIGGLGAFGSKIPGVKGLMAQGNAMLTGEEQNLIPEGGPPANVSGVANPSERLIPQERPAPSRMMRPEQPTLAPSGSAPWHGI